MEKEPAINNAALRVLSAGYLVLGLTSLSVIALDEPLVAHYPLEKTAIANFVTAFALVYAISAPLVQIFFGHFSQRKLVMAGLLILALAGICFAFSSSYWPMMISRLLMGLGGALVGPTSSALGATLAPNSQQARALGIVFFGMTLAIVMGVPAISWFGSMLGMRAVMLLLVAMILLVVAAFYFIIDTDRGGSDISFGMLWQTMTHPVQGTAIGITIFQMGAQFLTYSLIGAWLATEIGIKAALIPMVLFTYGVGGVIGNIIATKYGDRLGAEKLILYTLSGLFLFFTAFALLRALGLPQIGNWGFVLIFIWSVCGSTFYPPQQKRLVTLAPERANLLLALNGSFLYLGMSFGSFLSSIFFSKFGASSLMIGSSLLAFFALIVYLFSLHVQKTRL